MCSILTSVAKRAGSVAIDSLTRAMLVGRWRVSRACTSAGAPGLLRRRRTGNGTFAAQLPSTRPATRAGSCTGGRPSRTVAARGRAGEVDQTRSRRGSRGRPQADSPRESRPCGVFAIASARIASAIPGAGRSSTLGVASGVTSRGPRPGAARRQDEPRRSASSTIAAAMSVALVGDDTPLDLVARPPASSSASTSPLRSSRSPAATPSETVSDGGLHTGSFVFSTQPHVADDHARLSIALAMS